MHTYSQKQQAEVIHMHDCTSRSCICSVPKIDMLSQVAQHCKLSVQGRNSANPETVDADGKEWCLRLQVV